MKLKRERERERERERQRDRQKAQKQSIRESNLILFYQKESNEVVTKSYAAQKSLL